MSLIKAWYPDETDEKQWSWCQRLLETSGSRKVQQFAGMREAISELDKTDTSDDIKMFKTLAEAVDAQETEELIKSRVNQPRAMAENATPQCLKRLRPLPSCVLVYQIKTQSFQGYYPRQLTDDQKKNPKTKKYFSTSRSFGSGKWTKNQALTLIVRFLWRHHKAQGGAPYKQPAFTSHFPIGFPTCFPQCWLSNL